MSYGRYDEPRRGSIAWTARRLEQMLDHEASELIDDVPRSTLVDQAAPFEIQDYPRDSRDWAAQQFRLIFQREAREILRRARTRSERPQQDTGLGPQLAGIASAINRPATPEPQSAVAEPTAMSTGIAPPAAMIQVLGPAAAALFGSVEVPAWITTLGGLLALAPLLRGDATEHEDRFCHDRWEKEYSRCARWPSTWWDGCRKRAADRLRMCVRNGGEPDPEEPPEWGERDMEVSRTPRR